MAGRMGALLAGLALVLPACKSEPDACGGCGAAQICNPATRKCDPALAEGQPCTDGDGGPMALPCQEGTQCMTALSPPLCAEGCNPLAADPGCAGTRSCWGIADDAGDPVVGSDGVPEGTCVAQAAPGEGCGLVGLAFCDPGLACVVFAEDAGAGVCFAPCDPTASPDPCAAPQECLGVFGDPTQGLCAVPGATGGSCDDSRLLFCPKGQICLGGLADAGSCYVRCLPADSSQCPELESCVEPTGDPRVGICAQPQADGMPCDPPGGTFCEAQSFCIEDADGGGSCHQDCTAGESCPAGQSCLPIEGSNQSACG